MGNADSLAKMCDEPGVPESKEEAPQGEPETLKIAELTDAADETKAKVGMRGVLLGLPKTHAASPDLFPSDSAHAHTGGAY